MQITPIVGGISSPVSIRRIHVEPPIHAAVESFESVLADAVRNLRSAPEAKSGPTSAQPAGLTADSLQTLTSLAPLASSAPFAMQLTSRVMAAYQEIMAMQV